jgi:hypothetical protein
MGPRYRINSVLSRFSSNSATIVDRKILSLTMLEPFYRAETRVQRNLMGESRRALTGVSRELQLLRARTLQQ